MLTELVLEGVSLQRWIEEHNLPGPVRTTKMLKNPESNKTLDWIWINLGSIPLLETEEYQSLITAAKTQECKMVLLYWCGTGEGMEKIAADWEQWVSERYTDWSVSKHVIQNVLCGGPIRYSASLMPLASNKVNSRLGPFDEVEDIELMECFLDDAKFSFVGT